MPTVLGHPCIYIHVMNILKIVVIKHDRIMRYATCFMKGAAMLTAFLKFTFSLVLSVSVRPNETLVWQMEIMIFTIN